MTATVLSSLQRFLSSYPLTVALFVSKLPSPFSFKRALSRPKKNPPFGVGVESNIYRLEGSGLLLHVGSRGHRVRSSNKGHGALSFGNSMKSLAWDSSSMREEEQCQNDTVQFFKKKNYYFLFYFICGVYPKIGYNNNNNNFLFYHSNEIINNISFKFVNDYISNFNYYKNNIDNN